MGIILVGLVLEFDGCDIYFEDFIISREDFKVVFFYQRLLLVLILEDLISVNEDL